MLNFKAQERIDAVRSGRTDVLDLGGFDLTELPEAVFSLTRLRVLKVDNVEYRSNRKMLNMLRNDLDKYPELLEQLEEEERDRQAELALPRQLRYLDEHIGQLIALEVLDLSCNLLTELPETLGNLRNLRLLQLADNRLTHLPASLTHLPRLHGLDVRENPLRSLPDLPQLARYEPFRAHFRQQKGEAARARDYVLAAWFRGKEIEFGLTK
mgnify:CR=1 FL=1